MRYPKVPILMYHSIGIDKSPWIFRHLSCPLKQFERHLSYLSENGWTTISLQELYDYMKNGNSIPDKSVVITFDDGYLDNWVFAYPYLKKYGFKATIFVSPEFVDPINKPRPTLEDVWAGKITESELSTVGYLSWKEMRKMEDDRVTDIQSHALTHTCYFCGNEIIDFHHPKDYYVWLAWNVRSGEKYKWMTEDQRHFVPYGTPVYRFCRSLSGRRYFPDEQLSSCLIEHVKRNGDEEFFNRRDWKRELHELAERFKTSQDLLDTTESESAYLSRVRYEIEISKRFLEENLNKEVRFLSWPHGAWNASTEAIALRSGYLATTIRGEKNRFCKANISRIDRTSLRSWFPSRLMRAVARTDVYIASRLNSYRGMAGYSWLNRLLRLPHTVWLLTHNRNNLFHQQWK